MSARLFIISLLTLASALAAAEHHIRPGDPPQTVMDRAAPGDTLVFLPGLHQNGLTKHRSILYVDKPVHIELREDAILKLRDNETELESTAEITTDQDSRKKLDDMEVGGRFDLRQPCVFTIKVDSEGGGPVSDTFSWGVFHGIDNPFSSGTAGKSAT